MKYLLVVFFMTSLFAKGSYLNYSQPGDVLNIIVSLNKKIGSAKDGQYIKYYRRNFKLTLEDESHIANFNKVLVKHQRGALGFDPFSLAFYKARSVDQAVRDLKKVVDVNDLKTIVKSLKHLREKISKLISESQGFKGKIATLEKKLKKQKVFKAYENGLKFFGFKKNFKAKIYLLWAPPNTQTEVKIVQNIIFIKTHPLNNLAEILNEKFLLNQLVLSLFKSLPKSHHDNFEKTVFPVCKSEKFYEILGLSMGSMHHQTLINKKKYDPFTSHFMNKSHNTLALLVHFLYENQLKLKGKFLGVFPHKLKFVCQQLNS